MENDDVTITVGPLVVIDTESRLCIFSEANVMDWATRLPPEHAEPFAAGNATVSGFGPTLKVTKAPAALD